MDLRLRRGRRSMRIESTIEGFEDIVERATHFASHHGVELSASTRVNLKAMGIGEARANAPDDDGVSKAVGGV